MPRSSAYFEALSDDDELAERVVTGPAQPGRAPRRRMSDWTPTVELLTSILDRLGEVTQAIAALGGAKPRKVPRAPHPVTAFDRARNRKRQEKHRSIVKRVLRRPEPPPAPE